MNTLLLQRACGSGTFVTANPFFSGQRESKRLLGCTQLTWQRLEEICVLLCIGWQTQGMPPIYCVVDSEQLVIEAMEMGFCTSLMLSQERHCFWSSCTSDQKLSFGDETPCKVPVAYQQGSAFVDSLSLFRQRSREREAVTNALWPSTQHSQLIQMYFGTGFAPTELLPLD